MTAHLVISHHSQLGGLTSPADDHTQYLLIDGTRAMTGDLEIDKVAPGILFTDQGGAGADSDWSVVVSSDDLTIQNIDSSFVGQLVLDHVVNIRPNPRQPLPAFTSEFGMVHNVTVTPGGVVNGYFVLNDTSTVNLNGVFTSYGVISETSTVRGTDAGTTNAAYVFVNNMTVTAAALGNRPPVVHSFDSKPRLLISGFAASNCSEICALNDWTNIETTGAGVIVLDRWITVRATQFSPYYYNMLSSGVGSSITVTNRIGFEMGPIEKKGGGGTEQITNQYGFYLYPTSNVTTINCGVWIGSLTGAANNYGIVLASNDVNGGGDIWFGSGLDVRIGRGAANRLDLRTGDSFRIVNGQLQFGVDVVLSRGAADRLDLAAGDSFRISSTGALELAAATERILSSTANVIDIEANSVVMVRIDQNASPPITIFNPTAADIDFRVDSDTTTGMIQCDASLPGLGFFGATPVVKPVALTAALTQISHTGPATPDYVIATPVDSGVGSAWGFSTQDEFETVMSVILNLQTRLDQLESRLQGLGLLT